MYLNQFTGSFIRRLPRAVSVVSAFQDNTFQNNTFQTDTLYVVAANNYSLAGLVFAAPAIKVLHLLSTSAYFIGSPIFALPIIHANHHLTVNTYSIGLLDFAKPSLQTVGIGLSAANYFVGSPSMAKPAMGVRYGLSVNAFSVGSLSFAMPPLRIEGESMTQITEAGGALGILVLSYDPTGLTTVRVEGWPLVGWAIDETNPSNPVPVTIGNPLAVAPPSTGTIISPRWALSRNDDAVYVADIWRGKLYDFFTWLCKNNGANRKASAWLAVPSSYNVWQQWVRDHPDLVA